MSKDRVIECIINLNNIREIIIYKNRITTIGFDISKRSIKYVPP